MEDQIEVAKRRTQEAELLALQSGSDEPGGAAAAPACNAVFDETGHFVLYPAWRGIAVANVTTGKVRTLPAATRMSITRPPAALQLV